MIYIFEVNETNKMSEQENLPMVAEPKMPYGEQPCEYLNAKMVVSAVAFEKTVITYSPHKWGGFLKSKVWEDKNNLMISTYEAIRLFFSYRKLHCRILNVTRICGK